MFKHFIKASITASFLGVLVLFVCVSCVSDRTALYAPNGAVCALSPVSDSLEPYNRSVQAFNSGFEQHVANPISQIWRFLLPGPLRTGLSNFNENIGYPLRLVAHALEGPARKPLAFKEVDRLGETRLVDGDIPRAFLAGGLGA